MYSWLLIIAWTSMEFSKAYFKTSCKPKSCADTLNLPEYWLQISMKSYGRRATQVLVKRANSNTAKIALSTQQPFHQSHPLSLITWRSPDQSQKAIDLTNHLPQPPVYTYPLSWRVSLIWYYWGINGLLNILNARWKPDEITKNPP